MTWVVARSTRRGATFGDAVPLGYGPGLVGVTVFALGGIADAVWHQVFGLEIDLEALPSPSHLVLFVCAVLILSSPLRAAWRAPGGRSPSFGELLPALLSTTLVTTLVAFFSMHFSPWLTAPPRPTPTATSPGVVPDPDIAAWFAQEVQVEGFAAILVTTVILMTPTLLLLRRWSLPFGSLTTLFTSVSVLSSLIGFEQGPTVASGLVAGVFADALVRQFRPSPDRPAALRVFAGAVPAALWLSHFALLEVAASVGWPIEFWAGITCVASLTGVGLSLLVAPPPLPAEIDTVAPHPVGGVDAPDRPPVPA